jgi:hypothetical protein
MSAGIKPGRCAFCGCTEESPCNAMTVADKAAPRILGWFGVNPPDDTQVCTWANEDKTVCSVCDAVLKRLSELPELGYQRAIELTEQTREALRAIRAV